MRLEKNGSVPYLPFTRLTKRSSFLQTFLQCIIYVITIELYLIEFYWAIWLASLPPTCCWKASDPQPHMRKKVIILHMQNRFDVECTFVKLQHGIGYIQPFSGGFLFVFHFRFYCALFVTFSLTSRWAPGICSWLSFHGLSYVVWGICLRWSVKGNFWASNYFHILHSALSFNATPKWPIL